MEFRLTSDYQPTGDQPQAIEQLARGVNEGDPAGSKANLGVKSQQDTSGSTLWRV
jgi:excinuclease UvrABC helicase subunit UvrB